MKVMCDTNIILDVLLDRELFAEPSAHILRLCEKSVSCDCIVTRDRKGFADSGVPFLSPEELIREIQKA